MTRSQPRRQESEKRGAPKEPAPPPETPPRRGWGWSVAFAVWIMGFVFLAVMMFFDLIASLFR